MIKILIETDNAAFADGPEYEIARILRRLAEDIEAGREPGVLMDVNGNLVGTVTYK